MLHRQHQSQLVAGIGHDLKQFIQFRRKFSSNDCQIDLSVGDTPAGAPRAVHVQLHGHVRKFLAKQPDHSRHEIGPCCLAGADQERPPFEVVEIIKRPARLMALTENSIAVAEQKVARFSELSLATTTIEQGDLQLLLQVLNLQTDCRLGDVEAVGRLFETALTDDGPQDAQLIQGEGQIGHDKLPGERRKPENCRGTPPCRTPESLLTQHLVGRRNSRHSSQQPGDAGTACCFRSDPQRWRRPEDPC